MATETTDLTIELLRRLQADVAELRREVGHVQQSQVDTVRILSRLDSRVSDVKQDLESMLKMEIIGALAHHTTRIEQAVEDQVKIVVDRLARLEAAAAD